MPSICRIFVENAGKKRKNNSKLTLPIIDIVNGVRISEVNLHESPFLTLSPNWEIRFRCRPCQMALLSYTQSKWNNSAIISVIKLCCSPFTVSRVDPSIEIHSITADFKTLSSIEFHCFPFFKAISVTNIPHQAVSVINRHGSYPTYWVSSEWLQWPLWPGSALYDISHFYYLYGVSL